MVFHFIAIASCYSEGQRIGWHYASTERLDFNVIKNFLERIKDECGAPPLAIHQLSTNSHEFLSVIEKDSFFDGVAITKDEDSFIKLLQSDKTLSALDVAKYILRVCPMTHLKLQKMLYYIYADFLLKTNQKLFSEELVAFRYGPVVPEIYHKYKYHKSRLITEEKEDDVFELSTNLSATISFMKIVSSENGIEAMSSILATLIKYGEYSASELVDRTHKEHGPWERTYIPNENHIITDECILKYHHFVE